MNQTLEPVDKTSRLTPGQIWAKGLFWGWNLVFVTFMLLGFVPRLLPELVTAISTGSIEARFLLYAVVLSLIPVLVMALGYFFLRHAPERLFALGYVVEGPAMLLLGVRFFLIRQGSPALDFLMATAALGMGFFLWDLLDRRTTQRSDNILRLRLLGLTIMLVVAVYAAVWIGFYALPGFSLILEFLGSLSENITFAIGDLVWLPFTLLGIVLFVFTSSLFILAPVAVPFLAFRAWKTVFQLLSARHQVVPASLAVASLTAALAVLFIMVNRQPQLRAFALLANPPQSPQEARYLLEHEDEIRSGLLNAYLAPFRYLTSRGEVGHISDLYSGYVGFPHSAAEKVERLYEIVALPLLYQPVHPRNESASLAERTFAMEREPAEAARLYQRVFDETIVEGERAVIFEAARSTWNSGRAEAALQVLDEREVRLEQQELNITEHGDWAEFELHEVYRNTTSESQEVIYYFSLPETAVMTGVWLGESDNLAARYAFIVAPRGAAQAVYRNELRRNVDPALLEQIGPRQYRLRIFPVLPIDMNFNEVTDRWEVGTAPALHLWLTWTALAGPDGWPMPRLALKHNIFFDADVQRTINGQPFIVALDENEPASGWLPVSVPPLAPAVPAVHRVDLPGDITVIAEPLAQVTLPELPTGLRLALVLDRSLSVGRYSDAMADAVEHLRSLPGAQIDAYLTASRFRGESPQRVAFHEVNAQELAYYGGQNPAELLAQFTRLRAGREYDAVLVLTDASGYELGPTSADLPVPDAPVWFVHLGDAVPLGYDDATLAAILGSRGGVASNLNEALQRIAAGLSRSESDQPVYRDQVDGYVWSVMQSPAAPQPASASDDPGFAALAARRAILVEMNRHANQLDDALILDRLHQWATEFGIVSPYSSMIVLVDEQQEDLLRRLSQENDRFEREVEDLGETQPATDVPLAGVPEPHEWLLIGVALAFLAYALYTRRMITVPGSSTSRL